MEEKYKSLVEELNKLSDNFPATKDRMVEIAKILLTDHYGYLPRNKNKNGNDEMGKMSEGDKKIGNRKYCTKCRIKVDHELNKIYCEKHRVTDENRKRKPYVYREKS